MLGSNERLQRQTHYSVDGRRFSQISNELSASQTSIGSVGSDIQQHLQSMFYLLRPEETLKMVRNVLFSSVCTHLFNQKKVIIEDEGETKIFRGHSHFTRVLNYMVYFMLISILDLYK